MQYCPKYFFFICLLMMACITASAQDSSHTEQAKPAAETTQKLAPKAEMNVYPNPAKNKVTLEVKGFEPGAASVKILDAKGKLVREDNRLLTNGTEDIIMFLMLQPGIYFILVSEKTRVVRKKLVIM